MLRFMMTYKPDRIALGILHERHPFIHASGSQPVIAMTEDELWLSDDLNTFCPQGLQRLSHIVDLEVDERARGTLLQQQTHLACLEEQQPRRIKDPGRLCIEQALIESLCSGKIVGMLRDLQDIHESEFFMHGRSAGDVLSQEVPEGNPNRDDRVANRP